MTDALGVATFKCAGGVARPRPSIHHHAGSQRRPLQPRQKILAHLGVQNGCRIVTWMRRDRRSAAPEGGVERIGRDVVPWGARHGFIRCVHTVAAELSA